MLTSARGVLGVGLLLGLAAIPCRGADVEKVIDDARASHWAFQPLARPSTPLVETPKTWAAFANEIDAFVVARQSAKGVTPAPEADRRTLIRRVTFDLLGLPPSPQEVDAFLADERPDAYTALVDRLLASPRYGERWGRHWLDVARYADTKGYVFTQEPRYPYSYTFRDYVVRSFNEDLPYDRFVREQVAADRLEPKRDPRALAALGFLTLGRRFSNNIHDIIDDRIDVVTRGLLGLSVTCSRCHDHKYDPITMRDYYGLYGVFASAPEPKELPLIGDPKDDPGYVEYERDLEARRRDAENFREKKFHELLTSLRARAIDYMVTARAGGDDPGDAGISVGKNELRPRLVSAVRSWLRGDETSRLLAPWRAFATIPEAEFGSRVAVVHAELRERARELDPAVAAAFATPPGSFDEVVSRYRALLSPDGGEKLASARRLAFTAPSPFDVPADRAKRLFSRDVRDELRKLENRIAKLQVTHPSAPARAMVVEDAATPHEPRIFERGNHRRPGAHVARRYLEVLGGRDDQPFVDGSGRRELAERIVGGSRGLAARVLVNRLWMHHFGVGIVRTTSNFGLRGDPPSHPDLLEALAWRFVDGGWSVKRLQREIVVSMTYRQSSDPGGGGLTENRERDPENILLWHTRKRRLEFEALRDSCLSVAGSLDLRVGGRPVDIIGEPFSGRRTIYGFVDRQDLPSVHRAFDFANPDASCPQRHETIVPQQALFLMNAKFAEEMGDGLASRVTRAGDDARDRIRALYRIAFGREPDERELELGIEFVARAGGERGWTTYAQALLMSNEFMFVD